MDEADEVATASDVTSMPTIHLYRGGKKVAQHLGPLGAEYRNVFSALIKSTM